MRKRPIALLAALAAMALGGCGLGAGEAPDDVTLRISDGFGARTLRDERRPEVRGEDTAMRMLERSATVRTDYGGRFVQAIDGLAGGEDGPVGTRDWLFFVDGVIATRGAADVTLRAGDRIWWDRQDVGVARVGAVVGSFPAPFAGRDEPVVVGCATPRGADCAAAVGALRRAGLRAAVSGLASTAGARRPRILVGPWRLVRQDPIARLIERGPRASGVLARASVAGLRPLDAAARPRPLVRDWGLVAATRARTEPPTWVVTGRDRSAAARAARALRERSLAGHFAVAFDVGRPLPLPAGTR